MANSIARFVVAGFNIVSKALKEAYANVTQGYNRQFFKGV